VGYFKTNVGLFSFFFQGASRGLGFGLVNLLLNSGSYKVIATCRNPTGSNSLTSLKSSFGEDRLIVLPLDVTSAESHLKLKETLRLNNINSLDILIANAGILIREDNSALNTTPEQINTVFRTNVIGAMLTLQTFDDFVTSSPTRLFAVISSRLGSITNALESGGMPSYRMSKAAINSFAATFINEPLISSAKCKILCIHPGWVQTDMGGERAPLTIEQSVQGIENLLSIAGNVQHSISQKTELPAYQQYHELLSKQNCVFTSYDGELLEW